MTQKIPPPPPVANRDPTFNRWLLELTSIINATGETTFTDDTTAITQPPGTNDTTIATTAFVIQNAGSNTPSDTVPLPDATPGHAGTSGQFSRGDHVHPTDTTRAGLASPTFTGSPKAPTPAINDSSPNIATTAFVLGQLSTILPVADGTASIGTSSLGARADHRHPTDTSRAPTASPALAGTPTAPTAAPGTNTTQLATTAFVAAADALLAPLASPGFSGTPTAPTAPLGTNTTQIATTAFVLLNSGGGGGGIAVLRSYLAGLTLSTAGASTTFSVAPGTAADSTNSAMMTLAALLSKTTAAWAAGTAAGALDTGAIAASTWYHVHLIQNPTTLAVDVLISLSATAPTLPTGFTLFRRTGSMKTTAASQWVSFTQFGDEFIWVTPFNDANLGAFGAAPVLITLSVPPGVTVDATFRAQLVGAGINALLTSTFETSMASNAVLGNTSLIDSASANGASSHYRLRTNTTGQIRGVASGTSLLRIATFGWLDTRGKDF